MTWTPAKKNTNITDCTFTFPYPHHRLFPDSPPYISPAIVSNPYRFLSSYLCMLLMFLFVPLVIFHRIFPPFCVPTPLFRIYLSSFLFQP